MKSAELHRIVMCVAFFVFLSGITSQIVAQNQKDNSIPNFLIEIEKTNNTVKLVCLSGCNWKELHYTTTNANLLQAIDQYGMTELSKRDRIELEGESNNFLFTVEQHNSTITLSGIEGTAWKELSFSCKLNNCKQTIDQFGMTRSK
ncbi:hypothetical protein [uncultured Planktosalinus sp.]|uniref:hypothetical protein n=1 Tax=uncultured Planktosalinus sp. TaxID=1810935 RepID=UPI0030D94AEA